MGCDGIPGTSTVMMVVWSAKSTSTANYARAVEAMDMSKVKYVRATVQIEGSTGAFQCRAVYKYTNDKVSFDSALALSANQVNNRLTYGAWTDVTTGAKLFAEFGLEALNQSGTGVEIGLVTLRLDFREA